MVRVVVWPPGHAAVGYLLAVGYALAFNRRLPRGHAVAAVLVGTQLPDVIDKPLAWTFGVLPAGRSLGHSLLTAAVVVVAVAAVARRRGRPDVGWAFGVGYVSHLLVDAAVPVARGSPELAAFLAWPLVPAPEYASEPSFVWHLQRLALTPLTALELVLAAVALAGWWYVRSRPARPVKGS